MSLRFPGESADYRAARNHLLTLEIEARRAIEAAAVARRALPQGGAVPEDYAFEEIANGAKRRVPLSALFGAHGTLIVYSYMFGPEKEQPCQMCTPMLDCLDRAAPSVRQRASFVIVAESPAERLAAWTKERGWNDHHLLSTAGNGYNRAYHGKYEDGQDTTMLNVFHKDGDVIHHTWGSELTHGPSDAGQDHRGVDLLNPIFALLDVTPEGRGDFYTKLRS